MTAVRLERMTGARLEARLPELAQLRITVFRDFPYLYAGSLDYEERYLRTYAAAQDSVIVGAFDGDRLVGAATGLPLEHEPTSLTRPFAELGFAFRISSTATRSPSRTPSCASPASLTTRPTVS